MARTTYASIESTSDQAERLVAQGRFADAERYYRELVAQTHVIDYEYDDWLRRLTQVYKELGRKREAGFISLYLHYFDLAREAFVEDDSRADRARVHEVEKRWDEAARVYTEAGLFVHAAVALERAKAHKATASMWEELARSPALRGRDYEIALAQFNHGNALRNAEGDAGGVGRALIESQRLLEQVADEYEVRGERERAFDCYQILLKLGKDSGQFENLAEGYINCIRVLKDDNLKFYVLQYYEDFIKLALERGELHAAATMYQEAADFAVRSGLPYDRRYVERAADTWVACAGQYVRDGVPVELTENAMLAAVSGYSAVGNYVKVRETFEALAALELGERAQRRYAKVATKYLEAGVDPSESPEFPDYLRQQHAYAEIWFVDLLEWELAGDPHRVAMSIVGDLRYPNGIRRRALVILLTLADAASRGQETSTETLERIAEMLGELQSYAALNPLERLFEHEAPSVRRAAVRALRFLYFKRAFVILRKALGDEDDGVREAAIEALGGLHFPHAFNPLTRIFREARDGRVLSASLEAIGRIQSVESGEFLISVLRQEEGVLRDVAKQALENLDNADILPILRQYHQVEPNAEVRELLGKLARKIAGGA